MRLLRGGNERAPMTLRVDTRGSVADYAARLAAAGIDRAAACRRCDARWCSTTRCDVERLPGFDDGHASSVQDAAAQLAAGLLDLQAGRARVLDACAAPGGKSAHLLQRSMASNSICSISAKPARTRAQNLARIGGNRRSVCVGRRGEPAHWFSRRALRRDPGSTRPVRPAASCVVIRTSGCCAAKAI